MSPTLKDLVCSLVNELKKLRPGSLTSRKLSAGRELQRRL